MIKKILKFCNGKSTESSSAFSDFFAESSSREKKKIIKEAINSANKDQRDLVNRHRRAFSTPK